MGVGRAALEVQHWRCSVGGAALEVQRWRCSVGGAALEVQHWRCSVGGAALEVQHWTCSIGVIRRSYRLQTELIRKEEALVDLPSKDERRPSSETR